MSQPNGEPVPDTDLPSQSFRQRVTGAWAAAAGTDRPTGVVGAAKWGYQWGKQDAASSQSAPTHFGYVEDASTHGTWDNGDAGPELATAESLDELHSKVDDLQGSVSGMASSGQGGGAADGGQQGNQNTQQLTPSRMPERPPQVSPLAASAAQRQAAGERMAASQQHLAATRANFSANFAARQAQGSRVTQSGSGLGASDSMNESNMAGAIGGNNSSLTPASGLGSSASTWARKKFLN